MLRPPPPLPSSTCTSLTPLRPLPPLRAAPRSHCSVLSFKPPTTTRPAAPPPTPFSPLLSSPAPPTPPYSILTIAPLPTPRHGHRRAPLARLGVVEAQREAQQQARQHDVAQPCAFEFKLGEHFYRFLGPYINSGSTMSPSPARAHTRMHTDGEAG